MNKRSVTALAVVVGLLGALGYGWHVRQPPKAARAAEPRAVAAASATDNAIQDPLSPDRPPRADPSPRPQPADWVRARPAFQSSRSAAERGGTEPCATQEVTGGSFEPWARIGRGKLLLPRQTGGDSEKEVVLVIHLHGDEPVRRELIESGQRFALYAITLGPDEGYAPLFAARGLERMVAEVETVLGARGARVGKVVLSAWSAGFVGVGAALAQSGGRVIDAAVLIDGLHAPRGDKHAFEAQLAPFVDYATRASRGEGFLFVSHSSIDPPGFASTTECAHYLVATLGGKPSPVRRDERFGLELVEYFSRGDFHVRGYAGNDKADHCAQLALLRDVYAALGRRFSVKR